MLGGKTRLLVCLVSKGRGEQCVCLRGEDAGQFHGVGEEGQGLFLLLLLVVFVVFQFQRVESKIRPADHVRLRICSV